MSSTGTITLQVELLRRAGVHDRHRPRPALGVLAAQEARDLRQRALGGREADALQAPAVLGDDPLQPLEAQREVGAALGAGDGVDLVDDHRADARQDVTPPRGQQQEEALGRGDQHVGRRAQHPLAVALGRVAGADGHRHLGRRDPRPLGRRGDAGERPAQVALDVVVQRLQGGEVEHPARRAALEAAGHQAVQGPEEGGERLPRARGRQDEAVLARPRSPASRAPAPAWAPGRRGRTTPAPAGGRARGRGSPETASRSPVDGSRGDRRPACKNRPYARPRPRRPRGRRAGRPARDDRPRRAAAPGAVLLRALGRRALQRGRPQAQALARPAAAAQPARARLGDRAGQPLRGGLVGPLVGAAALPRPGAGGRRRVAATPSRSSPRSTPSTGASRRRGRWSRWTSRSGAPGRARPETADSVAARGDPAPRPRVVARASEGAPVAPLRPRPRRPRGPDHRPRRGLPRLGRPGQPLPRRPVGAVLQQHRPRPRRHRPGRGRPGQGARLLHHLGLPPPALDRAGGPHRGARAGGPRPRLPDQRRERGGRTRP